MRIESIAFKPNTKIPSKYTCDGENISPPLKVVDVPKEAESLVLMVSDPDAPAGNWVHWIVWNIDPQTNVLEEGEVPEGSVEGLTSFGSIGYGGPCPPGGTHRYFFKIFALSRKLDIGRDASSENLISAMQGLVIDEASLMGLYR